MWPPEDEHYCSKHVEGIDFCLTVHHQLGKVIQKNQLVATMVYWSVRSALHVSGNLLSIIRSVRLRFFTAYGTLLLWWAGNRWAAAWHYVYCKKGVVWLVKQLPFSCPPQQQGTISCKKSQSHAPDDGQKIARNMLSWSYRSINHCCK